MYKLILNEIKLIDLGEDPSRFRNVRFTPSPLVKYFHTGEKYKTIKWCERYKMVRG